MTARGKLILGTPNPAASGDVVTDISINFVIVGDPGSKGYLAVAQSCHITRVMLMADASGSAVIDIKKGPTGVFPSLASITASARPTLSGARFYADSTLTGWTRDLQVDDILEYVLVSISGINQITVYMRAAATP